MKNSTKHNF